MDCSPPGSSVHGILQARRLEWAAMPSFRASSPPWSRIRVSCVSSTAGDSLPLHPWEALPVGIDILFVELLCTKHHQLQINDCRHMEKHDVLHTIRVHAVAFIPSFPNVDRVATSTTSPWKDGGDSNDQTPSCMTFQ